MHVPKPPSKPKDAVNINQRITPAAPSAPRPNGSYTQRSAVVEAEDDDPNAGFVEKIKKGIKKRLDVPKAHTRMIVCALAVSLLWASSLVVCRLFVYSVMPRPTLDEVVQGIDTMGTVVDNENGAYVALVEDTVGKCRDAYEISNTAEIARWLGVLLQNNASLESYQSTVSLCSDTQDLLILQTLLLNNRTVDPLVFTDPLYFDQSAACSDVQNLFLRQIAARRAYEAVAAHDGVAQDTVSTLQARLAARAAYDEEFLANLTGFTGIPIPGGLNIDFGLDNLNVCLGATGSGVCSGASILNLMDTMYGDFSGVYTTIQNSAQGFSNTAQGFANTFGGVIGAIGDAASAIGVLQTDFSGFSCCNLNGLPWTATLDLSALNSGAGLGLPLPTTEEMQAQIQARADEFAILLAAQAGELDGITVDLTGLQADFWLNIDSDYDPPSITEGLGLTVDGIAEDFADQLGFISNGNITEERNQFFNDANATAANFLQQFDPRNWELYAYGAEVFNQFTLGTDLFTNYALLFDAVYRILVSLLLIRKYWNISAIATPPADIRNDSFGIYKEKRSLAQQAAYLLTHPVLNMLIIAIWVIAIALVAYFAYEPLYSAYIDGCVNHNSLQIDAGQSDGTMIFRNVRTVAENFAFTEGDNRVAEGIDTLNLEREFACRNDFDISLDERSKQNQTFVELERRQEETVALFTLLNTCVNWAAIDTDKSPQVLLDPLATTAECAAPFAPINVSDELLHDCAAVEPCVFTFDSSATTSVRVASHDASCVGEFYLHAYLLSWVFAIAMYVLLNIARLYFMRGVIGVWWRRITLGRFSYLQSCTESGKPIAPKEVILEGQKWSQVVTGKLKVALSKFERNGYFEIAYAVALQLPWIIGLSVLAPNLNFEP